MTGCLSNLVKYSLFTTNFIIFCLGLAVFGLGIWVIVDEPSFLDLFQQAEDVAGITGKFDVEIYTSAAYILMVVSILVVLVSFFGCCGAIKESKCMLGTYFVLILAMFIVMVVGAVLGYSGDLDTAIKSPLQDALKQYKDSAEATDDPLTAYKTAWNTVQEELKCCGVESVKDWQQTGGDINFDWTPANQNINKPVGCCMINRNGDALTRTDQLTCRQATPDSESTVYYFQGCYTMIKEKIEENQNLVVGVAIGVVVVMFLNMMFSFAMCTMVK